MPNQNFTFNIATEGLGRALPGKDYYSGLIFFPASLPTGFGASDRIKQVFSLKQAEALGITSALFPIEHYHVSEFFRTSKRAGGKLNLRIYMADPLVPFDGTQIEYLQDQSNGELRQIGVFTTLANSDAQVSNASASVEALVARDRPCIALLAMDYSGVVDFNTVGDLRALNEPYVGVVGGQDGGATGAALYVSEAQSITTLGATLGEVAVANVHENIGWTEKFNLVTGSELLIPAFANGQLVETFSVAALDAILDKGYIYIRKITDYEGTYHADTPLAVPADQDLAYIENARVMQKAIRLIRQEFIPFILSPVYVDAATGKISEITIEQYKQAGLKALRQMSAAGEINVDQSTGDIPEESIIIDPDQNVLATSNIAFGVDISPVGVGRRFIFNMGFTPKIA